MIVAFKTCVSVMNSDVNECRLPALSQCKNIVLCTLSHKSAVITITDYKT